MKAYKKESAIQAMYRYLYSVVLMLLMPILLLIFRKKMAMSNAYPGKNRSFKERFGSVSKDFNTGGVLIHCVSMGELNASVYLIRRIQNEHPGLPITVSTTSTTGAMHAYSLYKESVQHTFLPIDVPFFMHRFFDALKPSLVLVTEVEIWPNMMHQCVKRHIPVCLINARLSDDSLGTYQRLRFLMRPALRKFNVICAQSQTSFDNYLKLGVYKPQLALSLNMKCDIEADETDEVKAKALSKRYAISKTPILLAASTHETEESFMLNVYAQLKTKIPNLRLFIVPRHPHRFEHVYLQSKATGNVVTRFSDEALADQKKAQVVVVDTMGYLKACYKVCSAAFIGGSLVDKGGHNPLECALYAKPMVMGPSIYNNPDITALLSERDALSFITDEKDCVEAFELLLTDTSLAEQKGLAGKAVLDANRGAVDITYNKIEPFLRE